METGDYECELFLKLGSGNYVAVGLTSDTKMGDDFVMACASVSNKYHRPTLYSLTRN